MNDTKTIQRAKSQNQERSNKRLTKLIPVPWEEVTVSSAKKERWPESSEPYK